MTKPDFCIHENKAPLFCYSDSTAPLLLLHQSFVSPAPIGPGNSGAFNFSIFKALVKARHCGVRFVVKSLVKAPAPRGLNIMGDNCWELF